MLVERMVFLMRLDNMRSHVGQHVAHMIVGNVVINLTAAVTARRLRLPPWQAAHRHITW